MCFAIPKKVLKIEKYTALIEGNKQIQLTKEMRVRPGQYLQVVGNVAVTTLSQKEGLKIRKLIRSLNT